MSLVMPNRRRSLTTAGLLAFQASVIRWCVDLRGIEPPAGGFRGHRSHVARPTESRRFSLRLSHVGTITGPAYGTLAFGLA